jgi:ribonuclease BN (tRNA processing enzyme)
MNRLLCAIALLVLIGLFASVGITEGQTSTTKIVLLGTGTPRPNPDRSGPATAIVVGNRAYLVDFGPGVIRRAAAASQKIPALDPKNITVAFVTHLHSDHTAGYPDLIFTPWVIGRPELNVYGPEGIEDMTRHVLKAWRQDITIRTKGMEHRFALVVHAHDVAPGIVYKDDKVTVTAFQVAHGQWTHAFGYRFDTPDRSIVISGDTSPSAELMKQCQPCDVLIHEVFTPNAPSPAMTDWPAYSAKYHTTTDQLAEIGSRTKPGLLIMYHISGRAPDEQLLEEIQKTYHGKIVIGKDLEIY